MANLIEQWACKLKDDALDRLNVTLAGTDVSGPWALLKATRGPASETGFIYEGEPPPKCSRVSSITSDSATEEDIAPAVPNTSASLHSATSTPVRLTTSSLDQYNKIVTLAGRRSFVCTSSLGVKYLCMSILLFSVFDFLWHCVDVLIYLLFSLVFNFCFKFLVFS